MPKASTFAAGAAAILLPLSAVAAPESFTIDSFHSFPHFTVGHLGMSQLYGRFDKTSGKMTVDTAAKTGSVDIAIEAASVDTGDSERAGRPRTRDEHLRSPDFFNAQEFPRLTYKGKTARWTGDSPAEVVGELTLLGVTKPVTLKVEHWKCGPDPRTQGKRYMCGANATGSLKRSDFGMKFAIPGVGDEIHLLIQMEAIRD
ncbi:MAG TPA: YceI family protein [Burkholderiales bacterium]|nr:YceI family protein [Burkholderiales bacterium]